MVTYKDPKTPNNDKTDKSVAAPASKTDGSTVGTTTAPIAIATAEETDDDDDAAKVNETTKWTECRVNILKFNESKYFQYIVTAIILISCIFLVKKYIYISVMNVFNYNSLPSADNMENHNDERNEGTQNEFNHKKGIGKYDFLFKFDLMRAKKNEKKITKKK